MQERNNIAEPEITEQNIDPKAKSAWRISGGLASLLLWFFPIQYYYWYNHWETPFELLYPLAMAVLLINIAAVTILPVIRWRRWSYKIGMDEIELRHGLFIITRTLIPIYRVQHVDTRQGPLYGGFDLASVTISTAATTHEIPALNEETAMQVRSRISELARKAREDVTI